MKSNTRKKILALFAAGVLMTGTAFAAVATGIISTSPVTDAGTNLNAAGAFSTAANSQTGFSVSGTGAVLESDTTFPTIPNMRDALVFTVAQTGLVQSNTTRTYAANAGWDRLIAADLGGMITMTDTQVLTLKPGNDAGTAKRLLAIGTAVAGGVGNGGVLRINGGTTNLYGGDDNNPTNATTMNNYDGGTFLRSGRLNVAHSNGLGLGPLTLAEDTTFGVIETTNVDIGRTAPNGIGLSNPYDPATGVYPATLYHQNITVARYDNNNPIQNTRDVTFDVPAVAGINGKLGIYAGIIQPFANRATANPDPRYAVKIVKTGVGDMTIDTAGMRHLGGTHVQEGQLILVDGGKTLRYIGELGSTWFVTGGGNITTHAAGVVADETVSAKVNYDAYLAGVADGTVWGVRPANMNMPNPGYVAPNVLSSIPAYMNAFTNAAANNTNAPAGAGFDNPLTIDAGATVRLNRDQFIGDLNGAGTFQVDSWAKGGVEVIPQITMMLNNTLSTNGGTNADFSGLITGKANLVLDNPVQATGKGVNADQGAIRVSFFPRIQKLSSENNITAGDTFVKDGTLSIKNSKSIGPDTLRIGMYDAGYTTRADGVTAGTVNFRGFGSTNNVATFHGDESFTVTQKAVVYAPGLYVGGQLGPLGTDSAIPNAFTRSVTWYGNNPENVSNPGNTDLVGRDGQYNMVGPAVNLAASRSAVVSYPDIVFNAQNGAIPMIAQFSGKNYIRYNMMNAISINERLDENPNWDGTIALSGSWDLVGATSARMFGFDIKAGTLQLSEVQQNGYALVGIRQGATLRLGNNARDFNDDMSVVIEDDSRICVKPQTTDLATSLAEAQAKDPVFKADSINYAGLGMGQEHMDKRIVVQIDLANIGNSITDQWIKVVGSHNAPNWNNIHFYSSSAGQTEHLYKVKVAQPDNMVFDGNYSVTPYCDENQYNIYVHIKKIDQPGPTPTYPEDPSMVTKAPGAPTEAAQGAAVTIPFEINPASYDLTTLAVVTSPATDWTVVVDDATAGTCHITGTMPSSSVQYYVTATSLADSQTYKSTTYTMALKTTPTPSGSSSSSGCDAGFGAFALLAMAGGALVLRKKD